MKLYSIGNFIGVKSRLLLCQFRVKIVPMFSYAVDSGRQLRPAHPARRRRTGRRVSLLRPDPTACIRAPGLTTRVRLMRPRVLCAPFAGSRGFQRDLLQFFIAGENASKPLSSVDEAFDDVALAVAARRDDDSDLLGCERFSQRVGTVAFVGNNGIKLERGEQRFSLGEVMAFTPSQDEL